MHFLHKGSRTTGERESKIEEGAAKNQKNRERERDGRVYEAKEKKMLFLSVG